MSKFNTYNRSATFTLKNFYNDYENLTASDIHIEMFNFFNTNQTDGICSFSKTYDASTGTLTVNGSSGAAFYGNIDSIGVFIVKDSSKYITGIPIAGKSGTFGGGNATYNISSRYANYADLTADDIIIEAFSYWNTNSGSYNGQVSISKTYDPNTGVISLNTNKAPFYSTGGSSINIYIR